MPKPLKKEELSLAINKMLGTDIDFTKLTLDELNTLYKIFTTHKIFTVVKNLAKERVKGRLDKIVEENGLLGLGILPRLVEGVKERATPS